MLERQRHSPLSSSAARRARKDRARKRRHRLRQAEGRAVYSVEVGPEVIDLLCGLRWLAEADAGDRRAVGAAIGRLPWTRRGARNFSGTRTLAAPIGHAMLA